MTTVAGTLKKARMRLGLTQKELAVRAFADTNFQSLISRYEAGITEPSISTLRRIIPVLGLSLGDFDESSSLPGKQL